MTSNSPVAQTDGLGVQSPDSRTETLELRVRRLEDAVAMLQDTRRVEDRIVERLSHRLKRDGPGAAKDQAGIIVDAGRQALPAALSLIRGSTDNADAPDGSLPAAPRRWLLLDAYAEARLMVRLYFDPRFRPSWPAKIVPPVVLLAILTSWFWLPGTSILPSSFMFVVMKLIDVLLAFLAIKVLSREVRRYRETVHDIPLAPRP